jgi:hypothetical protein
MILAEGCAAGARVSPDRPTYLAQTTCWDTESCCIQRAPLTAVERCGADPYRVASVLKALEAIHEGAETQETAAVPVAEGAETPQGEEDAEAAARKKRLPKWKRKCMDAYYECMQEKWVGSCYDCFRRCEGQHQWPEDWCYEAKQRN